MKQKSEVTHIFSNFKAQVENLLNTTIKILRSDGGTEYKPITKYFPQIVHQTSCPYTPQQNGNAERKHRHIIELSLATMSYASIPSLYWDEIFSSVVFLINRLPSNKSIPFTSPFKKEPDYSLLRILGCLCFPLTRPYNSHKLELRSLPCVFLGYSSSQKGYRCLHLDTNKIFVSRNVVFDEINFPFQKIAKGTAPNLTKQLSNEFSILPLQIINSTQAQQSCGPNQKEAQVVPTSFQQNRSPDSIPPVPHQPDHTMTQAETIQASQITSPPIQLVPQHTQSGDLTPSSDSTQSNSTQADQISTPPTHSIQPNLLFFPSSPTDQPTTIASASTPLNPPTSKNSIHHMTTRTKDHTRKPRHFNDFVAHLASLETEPRSFNQANTLPAWREAMANEIQALALNKTWTLIPPPTEQKVIGSKWIYKIKRKPDGSIERFKARLVANGFHQEEGIDFQETYSPVVRATTIRVVLSIAVSSKWQIKQLDVHNAFLHGDLAETVYMSQPRGFVDSTFPDHVCLLHKSLYGLKQAPRAWFHKLSNALVGYGFKPSSYDPSLFIYNRNNHRLMVLVYVDDILVTGDDSHQISACIADLKAQFAIKDLGQIHYFLGLEAKFSSQGLHLTQSKYIVVLLSRVNMANCKPVLTPMATGAPLSKNDGSPFDDPYLYRSVVGALQYATLTRPEISFTVNKLSQFMHAPTETHWVAAKRVLRYLSGTIHHGLSINSTSSNIIHAYSDADWAGNVDDRRSTSGFCVYLGKNLVSWCAKKQPTVSRSSTEAEYRSLALTCTEILWLQFLLKELGVKMEAKPVLWCDNIGATFLAMNPMFHARTKHIEIDYHFVREQVAAKQIEVKFICSVDQLSDVMTKPLPLPRFQYLRDKLNVHCSPSA
ncbi:Gag/pol [Rhynchospora pubera]|uniref:Gag/pol n=1 Tax=Rhynchospora pubera TaxID=906938 RepID=A0AAV8D2K4_9POAL|nr:Gag/pol [Rhynchospora pubera]